MNKDRWSFSAVKKENWIRRMMAYLSVRVRSVHYLFFEKYICPSERATVLDVGVTPNEELVDSNFFESRFSHPENLTAASVEDCRSLRTRYPKIKFEKIRPNSPLPYKNDQFDVAVSWATLEHVGGYEKQQDFINELLRVGKKVFITTPYRGALYEPHTGFIFLQWLPLKWFRKICELLNKKFWSIEDNLNPLWVSDLKKMRLKRKIKLRVYRIFNLLPAHIIITTT